MARSHRSPFASLLSILGLVLLLAGPAYAIGQEWAARRNLRDGTRILNAAGPADAAARANASYHIGKARGILSSRWSMMGHGTWGVLSAVVGLVMVVPRRRKPAG